MKLSQPYRRDGFTLIELMISIAMVLVLLIGVNQVFTYTTSAVGAGQALSEATRDSRAAQTAFNADLAGTATDGPFLIIHSASVYAWRDRADYASDKDGAANTYTVTSPDDQSVAPTTLNFRNHRVDVLTFFSRGNFRSQTGDTQFNFNAASSEARIWYGLLRLPDNTYTPSSGASATSYIYPGLVSKKVTPTATDKDTLTLNPNNFFATDWVLGRQATLLIPNLSHPPTATSPQVAQYYSFQNNHVLWTTPSGTNVDYSPLSPAAVTTDSASTTWYARSGRFDVAQSSIANYTAQLTYNIKDDTSAVGWWNNFFVGSWGNASGEIFECNPFITATTTGASLQMTPSKAASALPYFLKHCSQFCVEFAGDFFTQENDPSRTPTTVPLPAAPYYGDITGLVNTNEGNGDGIDYYVTSAVVNGLTEYTRHTRWYGFPRNSNGGLTVVTNTTDPTKIVDTVPFRDVFLAANTVVVANGGTSMAYPPAISPFPAFPTGIPFERGTTPTFPTSNPPDYSKTTPQNMLDYLCAWGPDTDAIGVPRPKMIRITFTIDSGSKQLPDGQTFQYVYTLPN